MNNIFKAPFTDQCELSREETGSHQLQPGNEQIQL